MTHSLDVDAFDVVVVAAATAAVVAITVAAAAAVIAQNNDYYRFALLLQCALPFLYEMLLLQRVLCVSTIHYFP